MLTQSLAKFRQEDKIGLKRQNRFCNTGGNTAVANTNNFGLSTSEGKNGYRPPSSSATYNSAGGLPMQIRSRFQRKQPATIVRNSHSNNSKPSCSAPAVKK